MDLIVQNLLSPAVLCFALGAIARGVKSDLEVPAAIYQGMSIYLLLAIGLKGGVALSQSEVAAVAAPIGVTFLMGVTTPLIAFFLLKGFGRLDRINAAAAAAHYGSVSVVTFLAAEQAVRLAGLPTVGFLPALVAVLEVPGIIVGLALASSGRGGGGLGKAFQEVVVGKSILLLIGGMAIGGICGVDKVATVKPFFIDPFKGVLCLFLLELGIVAANRFADVVRAGWRLVVLGCVLPLISGSLGTLAGLWSGLPAGAAAILGVMSGSASYIAAPAAVRIALPKASPGIYLSMSLGMTFPFNLAVGIPVMLSLAEWLARP